MNLNRSIVASASDTKMVRLWETLSGEAVQGFSLPWADAWKNRVKSVVFGVMNDADVLMVGLQSSGKYSLGHFY